MQCVLLAEDSNIFDWCRHPCSSSACRSDSAVKQILLTMNEKQSFIIEDLDDFHVVIKADEEWRVRRELEAEVRTYCCIDNESY